MVVRSFPGKRVAYSVFITNLFYLQMAFLAGVTPVMHNFWDLPAGSDEYTQDLIQFMKVRTNLPALRKADNQSCATDLLVSSSQSGLSAAQNLLTMCGNNHLHKDW